jgi:meiotic recombination protein DMC1
MVLENISYCRAYTHEHQMALLTLACAKMIEERVALVIVDSATSLFRVDFSGRGQLADRQVKLGQFLSQLIKVSEEFNTAVYLTNQVVTECSGQVMGDPTRPIGGNIMAHACTTRLYLKKGRGEQRSKFKYPKYHHFIFMCFFDNISQFSNLYCSIFSLQSI